MDYLSHILTFLGGLAAGYTIRIAVSNSRSTRLVSQKGNTAGRDIVAGDNAQRK